MLSFPHLSFTKKKNLKNITNLGKICQVNFTIAKGMTHLKSRMFVLFLNLSILPQIEKN